MTLAEFRQAEAERMSEAQLQRALLGTQRAPGLADGSGWRGYHTHRSDRSPAGFPDLVLVKGYRLIFAELKRQKGGKTSTAQLEWLEDLERLTRLPQVHHGDCPEVPSPVEVYLWRPLDLLDGTIERILRASQ